MGNRFAKYGLERAGNNITLNAAGGMRIDLGSKAETTPSVLAAVAGFRETVINVSDRQILAEAINSDLSRFMRLFSTSGWSGAGMTEQQAVVSTADATVTTGLSVAVADGETVLIRAIVLGAQGAHAASGSFMATIIGGVRRAAAGNATLVGTPLYQIVEGAAGTDVTLDADTVTQTGRIRLTGIAATAINWLCHAEILRVKAST